MKNSFNNKSKIIIAICATILLSFVSVCLILHNISASECYIGNYDEYICYNGEVYFKICDENEALFSKEFYDSYQEYSISNATDLDERTVGIKGINPSIRFLTEHIRVVYNNSEHDEIVFLTLEHFPESVNYYAKPNK